jgi:hypothetical protein
MEAIETRMVDGGGVMFCVLCRRGGSEERVDHSARLGKRRIYTCARLYEPAKTTISKLGVNGLVSYYSKELLHNQTTRLKLDARSPPDKIKARV